MCGVVGVLRISASAPHLDLSALADDMSHTLTHRGPDANGVWVDEAQGVAFGHRRLSIIDLSSTGAQPMVSASGRYVLTYNGELYNHPALRVKLEQAGCHFVGTSDTEVLLGAIEHYGLKQALDHLVGMYAFALWDRQDRQLYLARDRMGEKPLYFGVVGGFVVFASEPKAFWVVPGGNRSIDRTVLGAYFHYGFVPGSRSIYTGIYRLLPGTFVRISSEITPMEIHRDLVPNVSSTGIDYHRYWHPDQSLDDASVPMLTALDDPDAQLLALLRDSVRRQCVADVPLGALLSGGIDSSTVVALMQEASTHRVKTFSIGFEEEAYNEAHHAALIADRLGTDHTELYVRHQDALDVIPNLSRIYDEPFADVSQIPTYLVSKLAKEHVTVALSGDGGDELFGGYTRYLWSQRIWKTIQKTPIGLRYLISKGVLSIPPDWLQFAYDGLVPVVPRGLRQNNFADKAHKLAGLLTAPSLERIYQHTLQHWPRDPSPVLAVEKGDLRGYLEAYCPPVGSTEDMLRADMATYLPDDILTKVDRASMAVSLEIRVPLLDHTLVEFAQRLPIEMKIMGSKGKWPLRNILNRYIDEDLYDRPKTGFGVPIGEWLRGPLKDWADDILAVDRIQRGGYLDAKWVSKRWADHRAGNGNWQYLLWDVLMFESWRESVDL